ncbi:ADP-ribosylglycohydrolase family protein [Streptomyces sp. 21So2-11]|uniref:ADP-ribosylglycohydrolase family protein n=1 Tax=Streptomyces sp. 21So2-11 TaxID=3144408 RepID=UPI003219597F
MASMTTTANVQAARRSLEGLALGDAFGERWFPLFRDSGTVYDKILARRVPEEPHWPWTDDTAMARGIMRVLDEHGEIRQTPLANSFSMIFMADQARGYGSGMHELLPQLMEDASAWPVLTRRLFGGEGSLGNGAAMRVAPLGAWFSADLEQVVVQAELSARVTHAHPQGVAGAVAVAVAAALSVRGELSMRSVAERTPGGPVRDGLLRAADVPLTAEPRQAAELLGSGYRIRADDTVPFALWTATRHPDDLEAALWSTAEGLGDVDTTCAITGGIVAARTGVGAMPGEWLERRESLA